MEPLSYDEVCFLHTGIDFKKKWIDETMPLFKELALLRDYRDVEKRFGKNQDAWYEVEVKVLPDGRLFFPGDNLTTEFDVNIRLENGRKLYFCYDFGTSCIFNDKLQIMVIKHATSHNN